MTRHIYLFLAVLFAISAYANEKITGYSYMVLSQYQEAKRSEELQKAFGKHVAIKSIDSKDVPYVEAFIAINEDAAIPYTELNGLDAEITTAIGNTLIVSIPIDKVEAAAELESVKSISIAKKLRKLNDKSRVSTETEAVQTGLNMPEAFNGKDVVVGVVDIGIDFNHINFLDADGNTRIKLATVNGKQYTTSSTITNLTTDYSSESHGTHTSGIAGGGYTLNGLHGMAPESDLVLCGLGDNATDTRIVTEVKNVFNYAESVGKPAVVNLSLGSNIGPHDGTSALCASLDELAGEGRIIVMSAGNEGDLNLYLNHTFTTGDSSTPELCTILENDGSKTYDWAMIDSWSRDNKRFGVQLFVYNKTTKTELIASDIFYPTTDAYTYYTWKKSSISSYFSGTIALECLLDDNNRYNIYTLVNGSTTSSKYRIGMKFYGEKGTEIDCWTDGISSSFEDFSNTNYTAGTPDGSYNEMSTGFNTISVGAYSTRSSFKGLDGKTYGIGATVNDIAYFSSYGIDINGISRPDVAAPGHTVISSVNKYDTSTTQTDYNMLSDEVEGSSRNYHWGFMSGTSMSSPTAAGIIALWLQANPNLSCEDVRAILKETSTTDEYTAGGNAIQWGAGKINAKNGLLKILKSSDISDITLPEEIVMLYPNPSDGKFSAYVHNSDTATQVNIFSMNGNMVYNNTLTPDNGIIDVDLSNSLPAGIYLVRIKNDKATYTSRLIIK